LRLSLAENELLQGIQVETVDSFQGKEQEVVVLSLVRSNDRKEVGFLCDSRRLNVAVTRAKRHIAVIGDSDTVCSDSVLKSLFEYVSNHPACQVRCAYEIADEQMLAGVTLLSKSLNKAPKPTGPTSQRAHMAQKIRKLKKAAGDGNERHERLQSDKPIFSEFTLESQLQSFLRSDEEVLSFPCFDSYHRMLVHEICTDLGLLHKSEGSGNERHVVVRKSPLKLADCMSVSSSETDVSKVPLQLGHCMPDSSSETEVEVYKSPTQMVPSAPDLISESVASKPEALLPEKHIPVRGQKKKKSTTTSKGVKSEDNDEIKQFLQDRIAENLKLESTCNFPGCSVSIRYIKQSCGVCACTFCLTHRFPEVHGCDASKRVQDKRMPPDKVSAGPARDKLVQKLKQAKQSRVHK